VKKKRDCEQGEKDLLEAMHVGMQFGQCFWVEYVYKGGLWVSISTVDGQSLSCGQARGLELYSMNWSRSDEEGFVLVDLFRIKQLGTWIKRALVELFSLESSEGRT